MMMRSLLVCAVLVCVVVVVNSSSADAHSSNKKIVHPTLPPHQVKESIPCDACQIFIGFALKEIEANGTVPAILDFLEKECNKTGILAGICDKVAEAIVKVIPLAEKGLHTLGLDDPIAVCSLAAVCSVPCCNTPAAPEQVHIALTGDMSEMQVSWATLNPYHDSLVLYGINSTDLKPVQASVSTYTDGGWIGTLYTATLTGLSPSTNYVYQVGSPNGGYSVFFNFTTLSADPTKPIRYAVVGDLGATTDGDATIAFLNQMGTTDQFDVVLHIGDISYANGYEIYWDIFLRKVQPVASHIPYMTIPGNHEIFFNFSSYKNRWPMPGKTSGSNTNLYYSIDIGSVHFIAINSESVINTPEIDNLQLEWIKNDFAKVHTRRQNGEKIWVVAYMHRPLYCTNNDLSNCNVFAAYLQGQLEDLFYHNRVAFVFAGHQHDYERMLPTYKGSLDNSAPAYILNGAGGNREGVEVDFAVTPPKYSAYRDSEWGYGILNVFNNSLIQWSFYGDDGDKLKDQVSFGQ